MAEPVITESVRVSESVYELHMSNDTILFGCAWPGCHYVSENPKSIPSHYKTHSGKAAQRRRGKYRPRSDFVTNDIATAALALLDMVQQLVSRIDSFDAEYREMQAALIEQGEDRVELIRKAEAYDRIMAAVKGVADDEAPGPSV